jgi:hypothetical protein
VAASINRQERSHGRRSREAAAGAECLQLSPIWLAPDGSRRTLSILDTRIGSRAACAVSARCRMPARTAPRSFRRTEGLRRPGDVQDQRASPRRRCGGRHRAHACDELISLASRTALGHIEVRNACSPRQAGRRRPPIGRHVPTRKQVRLCGRSLACRGARPTPAIGAIEASPKGRHVRDRPDHTSSRALAKFWPPSPGDVSSPRRAASLGPSLRWSLASERQP